MLSLVINQCSKLSADLVSCIDKCSNTTPSADVVKMYDDGMSVNPWNKKGFYSRKQVKNGSSMGIAVGSVTEFLATN